MKRLMLAGGLLCLLFSLVRPLGAESTDPGARTDTRAIFFYLAATLNQAEGNFTSADRLFREALKYDSASSGLKKQYLLNAFELYADQGISARKLRKLIREHAALIAADFDLLFAEYGFFDDTGNVSGLTAVLDRMDTAFPGVKSTLLRYIFEMKYNQNPDAALLDQALEKAGDDPEDYLFLAQFFRHHDRQKEKQALLRYHTLSPSQETHRLFIDAIVETGDSLLARDYVASLSYPVEREQLAYFAQSALQESQFKLLTDLSQPLLNTRDLELLSMLGLAALLQDDTALLDSLDLLLPELPAPAEDKQGLQSVLAANVLLSPRLSSLDPRLLQFRDTYHYSEILSNAQLALNFDPSRGWLDQPQISLDSLRMLISARVADTLAVRFLLETASQTGDSLSQGYREARAALALSLRDRGQLSLNDYQFLTQYYYDTQDKELRYRYLEEALRFYPGTPDLCNSLGYSILIDGGDYERAGELIRQALTVDPENPFYLDSLAWYHYLQEDYPQALELISQVFDMEDLPSEIAWHIGAIYYRLNDPGEAKRWLQRSIDQGDDPVSVEQARELLRQLP